MGNRPDDRPETSVEAASSTTGGDREPSSEGDWESRHARTTATADESTAPAVRIDSVPADCDWHVRHSHVRELADR